MGASISSVSPLQGSEVARRMREEYESSLSRGMSPEAQQKYLIQKYDELVQSVTKSKSPMKYATKNSKRMSRGVSKAEIDLASYSNQNQRSHYRSYDTKPLQSPRKSSRIVVSKSQDNDTSIEKECIQPQMPAPSVGVNENDTWDSVKGQPSCLICSMLFPTAQKLLKHEKYSSHHQAVMKKMEARAAKESSGDCEKSTEVPQEFAPTTRCRALYTGHKYFWRLQDTFEVHIYEHYEAQCIEVIAHEGKANTELPRIYMDENALISHIGKNTVIQRVDNILMENSYLPVPKVLPPYFLLYEEEKRIAIASHILGSLWADHDTSRKSIFTKQVFYSPSPPVTGIKVVLDYKPVSVTPVFIARRRHSTKGNVSDTLEDIGHMQHDIKEITRKTDRLADLVSSGVNLFTKLGKRQNERMQKYSTAKRRWLWAIEIVLRKNRVRATREILHLRSHRKDGL